MRRAVTAGEVADLHADLAIDIAVLNRVVWPNAARDLTGTMQRLEASWVAR